MIAAIVWSLMGTGLLAVVGIKLPGLEFKKPARGSGLS